MNIQIYYFKKDFDAQKAERYFKERRIPFHIVDMKKHTMGMRELQTVKSQVGIMNMIDRESKLYQGHFIRMLTGEQPILEALIAEPRLLRTPIVRNGNKATVGYCPEIWESWE